MRLKHILLISLLLLSALSAEAGQRLDSKLVHGGGSAWKMLTLPDVKASGEAVSSTGFDDSSWMDAVVPGTVLGTLVANNVFPEPYYGRNNKIESGLIPDLSKVGRDFYTAWYRTTFDVPARDKDWRTWLRIDGINYRAEIWVNGRMTAQVNGMFRQEYVDVTDFTSTGSGNVLAVKVFPVDVPGSTKEKSWGAPGEFRNGGDGLIGLNTTMLMSVGWDFTFMDGIRDRNTGIWKGISVETTGPLTLRHPFVKSSLSHPDFDKSSETISVEVVNPSSHHKPIEYVLKGEIPGEGIKFEKKGGILRGLHQEVTFSPEEFPQLNIDKPRLWWPVNKGPQNLYRLKLELYVKDVLADSLTTTFGIREITSDRNTPDESRCFYVNGKRLFIRGSNWIPEAMLRMSPERTAAELRYTRQAGINLLRLWGGGIVESDDFYRLCDELGILVWQEFWLTGDTMHPQDQATYLANVESTVKNIRNHPSLAYYVDSNESSEVSGTRELIAKLDGTRGYQMQSECEGVHDGSPYKQVNPMRHYENTASDRGSRVDGFNPEYGSPCLPLVQELREMMPESDLWPIDKETWDYLDGAGFSLMTSLYRQLTDQYGESSSIDEFAKKAQLVGAMNYKSIWEVWNYNKLGYGDRWTSGVLFWYHNSAIRHVGSMMWDWSLEPMASLYAAQNALEPIHIQFDYLKNTVSVVNDLYEPLKGLKAYAAIYNLKSRKIWEGSVRVDVDEDGVACDVMKLDFPESLTQVHFIKLKLTDAAGKVISENFYWRSKDEYEGKKTLTGPCTSGFQSLASMPGTSLKTSLKTSRRDGRFIAEIRLSNKSSKIAFFNQIQFLDAAGSHVRPSFCTDNFFTLMPGETRTVTVETDESNVTPGAYFQVGGWNVPEKKLNF